MAERRSTGERLGTWSRKQLLSYGTFKQSTTERLVRVDNLGRLLGKLFAKHAR